MNKVYLKFRLEVLPGNYLLFQNLYLDPRFESNAIFLYDENIPLEYLKRFYNGDTGKDCIFVGRSNPLIISSGNVIEYKEYLLKQISYFWKWGGFSEDFNFNNRSFRYRESSSKEAKGRNYKFENFNNGEVFLNYDIWQSGGYNYLKVYLANEVFRSYSFNENSFILDHPVNFPGLYADKIRFKGSKRELDDNTVLNTWFTSDIDKINNQVLKFLNEKLLTKSKTPELREVEPNVYELRVFDDKSRILVGSDQYEPRCKGCCV